MRRGGGACLAAGLMLAASPAAAYRVEFQGLPQTTGKWVIKKDGGVPFFPIGLYNAGLLHDANGNLLPDKSAAIYRVIRAAGFNTIQSFAEPGYIKQFGPGGTNKRLFFLDTAREAGLMVLSNVGGMHPGGVDESLTRSMVQQARGHPAVLAWKVVDEPSNPPPDPNVDGRPFAYFPDTVQFGTALILAEDNRAVPTLGHPTLLTDSSAKPESLVAFPFTDAVAEDRYPPLIDLTPNDVNHPATMAGPVTEIRRKGRIPLAVIPVHSASYGDISEAEFGRMLPVNNPLLVGKLTMTRVPTYKELRLMTALALIHGAKGIFFYAMSPYDQINFADVGNLHFGQEPYFPKAHWANITAVAQELQRLVPVLTGATMTRAQYSVHSTAYNDFLINVDRTLLIDTPGVILQDGLPVGASEYVPPLTFLPMRLWEHEEAGRKAWTLIIANPSSKAGVTPEIVLRDYPFQSVEIEEIGPHGERRTVQGQAFIENITASVSGAFIAPNTRPSRTLKFTDPAGLGPYEVRVYRMEERLRGLANPGFEQVGGDGIPLGWTALGPVQAPVLGAPSTHSGFVALKVDGTGLVAQAVPVTPGKTYALTQWTRGETGGEPAMFLVLWYNAAGQAFAGTQYPYTAQPFWQKRWLHVTAPTGATAAEIYARGVTPGKFVWYDDVVWEEVRTAFNLGFEDGTDAFTMPGWARAGDAVRTGETYRNGSDGRGASVRMSAGHAFYQDIPIAPGTKITVSAYARETAPGARARLQMNWLDQAAMTLGGEPADFDAAPPAGQWGARITKTFVAPSGASFAELIVTGASFPEQVYYDDFELLFEAPGGLPVPIPTAQPVTTVNQDVATETLTLTARVAGVAVERLTGAVRDTALALLSQSGATVLGQMYDVTPDGQKFDPPATVTISYDASVVSGVDPTTLRIGRFSRTTGTWVLLPTTVDSVARTATASIAEASFFALITTQPLDRTPPLTVVAGAPALAPSEGQVRARLGARLTFTATDEGSGVREIAVTMDGRQTAGSSPLTMTLNQIGLHTVTFQATDLANNMEPTQTMALVVDGEGPAFARGTPLRLEAEDPGAVVNGLVPTAAGLELPAHPGAPPGVWESAVQTFADPVRIQSVRARAALRNGTIELAARAEGGDWAPISALAGRLVRQVQFRATLTRTDPLDRATPEFDALEFDAVRPTFFDSPVLQPGSAEVTVAPSELLSGVPTAALRFRDGSERPAAVSAEAGGRAFRVVAAVAPADPPGRATMRVTGTDLVGNAGETAEPVFIRDGTPPRTTLVPSEPLVTAEGRTFLRSNVTLGFTAEDPVVDGFAAGVAETRAAVDPTGPSVPGPTQAVTAPLTIPVEGRYTLRFQSEDKAGNVEPVQSVALEVDNTAPTFAGARNRRVEAEASSATLVNLNRVNGSVRPKTKTLGPVPNGDFEASPFLAQWTLVSGSAEPGGLSPDRVFDGTQSVLLRGGLAESDTPPAVLRSAPFVFGSTHGQLRVHVQPLTSFVAFSEEVGERGAAETHLTVAVIDAETGVKTTLLVTQLGDPRGGWEEPAADLAPLLGRQIQVELTVETQSGFSNAPVSEVLVDAVQDGALEFAFPTASLVTDWISISPQAVRLEHFRAVQAEINGTITHAFTTDGSIFHPVSELPQADLSSRRIRFRSDLTIADVTKKDGSALDALLFEEVLAPRVSPAEVRTGETVQIAFPVSEPLRSTPTVALAVADGSTRVASFTTQAGLDFVYTYTVQPKDPNGPATIAIAAADRAGNVGQDVSLSVKLITDQEPPVTLLVPDTDLYPDGTETFSRPVTFTLTAIDPGRELARFDFTDPALQGQPDPRWRVLSGAWTVDEQAYRGLAGINEPEQAIRALSVTDHFTDYLLQLNVEDEIAGEDTSVGVLLRAQEAVAGQVTGGYAVRLSLTPGRGDGGDPGRISLWKLTGSTSAVRLAVARLPQPSLIGNGGSRRRVPVTMVLQGHRIRVAPHGIVALDVSDPEGPLDGHLGLEVSAADEGSHAARFDGIRLLDLSDLTVASGVTTLETTVASTPETVLTPGTSVTVAITEPGAHTLAYHAVDAAGNAEPSRTVAVVVDTSPPTLALTQATPEFVAAGPVGMTVTASEPLRLDPMATVNGRAAGAGVSAQPTVEVNYRVTAADAEGVATLVVQARDRAGNLTTLTTQPFEVDRTPPAVMLQTPRLAVMNPAGPPGVTETVRLPAVVSEPGTYQVTLVGPAGGTLRALPAASIVGGPVAVSWDGRTDQGLPMDTTGVTWKAVVEDRAGNRTEVDAARAGVPGVGLDARQPILTNLALPPIVAADAAEVLVRYALHLPQGGAAPVRFTVLTATGGVVRTLLPRADDPGLRGGGELVERWDGRDGAGRTLEPGAYWVLAEAGGEDAAPTPTRANPALVAFAVVGVGADLQVGPSSSSSVTVFVPGAAGGISVTAAPPRTWPVLAAQALHAEGAGRVTVGGVRPEGEVRLLQATTDVLTTLLPAGPAVRIEPDAGLPVGTVLVATLPATVEPDQVGLYRYDGTAWVPVGEQTGSPADGGVSRVVARLDQGGLYAVLRPTDTVAPVVGTLSAPPAFSPNADGRRDTFPVAHGLADSLYRLLPRETLTVTDAQGQGVARQAATRPLGAATAVWTGLDATGRAAPEGRYTWVLEAEDAWGNRSGVVSSATVLDVTPPTPQFSVASPSAVVNGVLFSQPGSVVTGTGADPLSGGVASGVREVRLTLDSPATTLVDPLTITTAGGVNAAPTRLMEGQRTLTLAVEDEAGNVGIQIQSLAVDATPPGSTLTLGQPQCAGTQDEAGLVVVGPSTPLDLVAADPLAGSPPVASGVSLRQAAVDTAPFQSLASPFTLTGQPDGRRTIRFRSVDAVQNVEAERSQIVVQDATPPTATLAWPDPTALGLCAVLSGAQVVRGTVADRHLQDYRVEVGAGLSPSSFTVVVGPVLAGSATTVTGRLGTWDTAAGPQGWVTLRVIARDCVVNASTVTAQVFVGQPTAQIVTPAGLGQPGYLTVASSPAGDGGLVYLTDEQRREVRVLTAEGTAVRRWGQAGNGPGEFNTPEGIAVSSAEVFVADRNNDRVQVFSRTGTFLRQITTMAGATPPGLNKPHGVALDAAGHLYIADRNNDRVLVVNAQTGALIRTVSTGLGVGDLNKPQGVIAVDGNRGRLYVTDRNHDRVLAFRIADGAFDIQIGTPGSLPGQLNKPDGLAVDGDGCLVVGDRNNSRLQVWNAFQDLTAVYGSAGHGPGQWNHPGGLAVASDGSLWACDTLNKRLQRLTVPARPAAGGDATPPLRTAAPRPAQDLSALGPPHDFAIGPNPARAGAPVNVYFVTGWRDFETEGRVYTAAGEPVSTTGGEDGRPGGRPYDGNVVRTYAVPWGAPAYAPGRYAVAWAPRQESGEPLASGVYLIQIKVRNPDSGEIVPALKKILIVR